MIPRLPRAVLSVFLAFCLAFGMPAAAMGPLEKNHPAVERGLDAYQDGRFEEALAAFEQAEKELPDRPAVPFNQGNALYKLGRYPEANRAYQRAAELDRKGELTQQDWYNTGNALAQMGQTADAIAAYRKALTLDPADEQARHNLEVLLRKLPPKKPKNEPDGGPDGGPDAGTDAGQPDAGRPDAGQDGGSDGGSDAGSDGGLDAGTDGGQDAGPGDGGQGDGGQGDGGQGDGGRPQRGDGGVPDGGEDQQGAPDDVRDGGTGEEEDEESRIEAGDQPDGGVPVGLRKQDAERILDAMKQSEKNLQLWRFQQKKKKVRRDDEKDW